jgi:transposase
MDTAKRDVSINGAAADKRVKRIYTDVQRLQIVEEALAPGACVAKVARRHGINDNVIFNWRRLYCQGLLPGQPPQLVPVQMIEAPEPSVLAPPTPSIASAHIEIELHGHRVRLQGAVDTEVVREVLRALLR